MLNAGASAVHPRPVQRPPLQVFVAGTFDGLHYGHLFLLRYARRAGLAMARRLRRPGVRLSVVIARDDSVQRIKVRPPHHTQRERQQLVAALRLVDRAFVGQRDDFIKSVRRAQPDLIVLGYDQSAAWEEVLRSAGVQARVVRCQEYRGRRLKSSMIRGDLERMRT
ncbi:MAG: adenylyltransferase/cytidyltransferase family protein [Candidatus Binatia bacterium]